MGWTSEAYATMRRTKNENDRIISERVFNILRANNRPGVWCIDANCDDTNWGGFCRLHSRGSGCPEFRTNGGWF